MTTVKLRTVNVNGMNDSIKRKALFQKLLQDKCNVIYLQETHASDSIIKIWKAQWPGKSYWSNGTSGSRGVAILFQKDFDVKVLDVIYSSDGRCIVIKCNIQELTVQLINVYAPVTADAPAQLQFVDVLEKICNGIEDACPILLAGDFNTVVNPSRDRKDFDVNTGSIPSKEYWKRLLQVAEDFQLSDIWRIKNPTLSKFTFHRAEQAARLDWWLISEELTNKVTAANIIPWVLTDHAFVDIDISLLSFKRGPGLWKLNTTLLKDIRYIDCVKKLFNDLKTDPCSPASPQEKWEFIKFKIKETSIQFANKKTREKHKYIYGLETEVTALTALSDLGIDVALELATNKRLLKDVLEEKARSAAFRAKAKWAEHGEKCSKYFLNLEKSRAKNKIMSCIKDKQGNVYVTQEQIAAEQVRFYKDLYTPKEQTDQASWIQENQFDVPQLDNKLAEQMVKPIPIAELAQALKAMSNNKTPGTDGIPADFYKVFWREIREPLALCFQWVLENGQLTQEQSRGVICLIPKKEKDKARLENWRPITLLNCDYKIFTKVLAKRLILGVHEVIHVDQTGYIPKRNIGENIRTVNDIIDYCNHTSNSGVLVGVDFFKAFDTLDWESIFLTLKLFGFHPDFIKWIQILFKSPTTAVLNAGWTSEYFTPTRGIRQGCPISGYLFILVIEILALKIRSCSEIKGIKVDGHEFKLSVYADDLTGFVESVNDAEIFLDVVRNFKRFSGLQINLNKTEALPLGTTREQECELLNVRVVRRIRILGVYFRTVNTPSGLYYDNHQPCIEKMRTIVASWINRDLSLKGKVTVINTLIVSLLGFLINNIFTPPRVISEVKSLIVNYLWAYKKSKVAYSTVIQKVKRGGLNLCDIQTRVKAANIVWVKKYIEKRERCHSTVFLKHICNWNGDIYVHLKTRAAKVEIKSTSFHFYKVLVRDWYDIYNWIIPDKGIFDEYLWGCKFWQLSSIFDVRKVNKWKRAGIWRIRDIVKDKSLMSFEQINTRYNVDCNFIDLLVLRTALPEQVKVYVQQNDPPQRIPSTLYIPSADMEGTELFDITAALAYEFGVIRQGRQYKPIQRWYDRYSDYFEGQIRMEWPDIYMMPYIHVRETKLQTLQFKVIHRIIPCNKLLKIYKIKDSNKCEYCNKVDDIPHFFVSCPKSKALWVRVWAWLERHMQIRARALSNIEILLGVSRDYGKKPRRVLNTICIFTKFFIYRQRLYHGGECSFELWYVEFKARLQRERFIVNKSNPAEKSKVWEDLLDLM